jgi:formylglycine-generating enzyme required for sulfatase activity
VKSRLALDRGIILLVVHLLCGCGGEDEIVVAPAAQPAAQPRQRVARAQPAPPPKAVDPRAAAPKRAEQPKLPRGTRPEDVFRIANGEGNFVIVGLKPDVKPTDVFFATLPPPGQDSTAFAVVTSDRRAGPAQRRHSAAGVKLPEGFEPIAEAGYHESGLPLRIRCVEDGSEMALIPSGPAVLGANSGPENARPRVTVELDAYYIDEHEVTVSQYEKFRNWWRETKRRLLENPANAGSGADQPAAGIAWGDARNYARWLGKELPTEAQWEKAARGEQAFNHPWGNGRALWTRPRSQDQIDAIKSHISDVSVYGVYDLAGNVREWCLDWYSDQGHREAAGKGASEVINWEGVKYPSSPNLRVVKGNGPDWNAAHRSGVNLGERSPAIGFRCVLRLQAEAEPPETKSRRREF